MNNKNKYLIAIDLDGTLLNKHSKITWFNKYYLKKLDRKGHIIVLASGRPARAVKFFYNQIGLTGPIICYNGAYTFHPIDKKFPTTAYNFKKQLVLDIYKEVGKEIATNCMCETDEQIWLEKHDEKLNRFFWQENMDIIYGDINETLDKDPWTFILQLKDRDHNDIIRNAVLKHKGYLVRFWTTYPYAEIYDENTSKAASIHQIAEYYGIPKERTIGIGDADNDIEMMQECGTSIAMKNGNKHVKALATMISRKDHNHHGVAFAIKDFFKKNKVRP